MDLILRGDQLALQIHESCGHPTELDKSWGLRPTMLKQAF
jgi:predicted Zn-dependent protease